MNYHTLKDKVCCPFDKHDLDLQIITLEEETEEVIEGVLSCEHCRRVYPIISGIPIMVPDEYREKKLEQPLFDKVPVLFRRHLRHIHKENLPSVPVEIL